MTKNVQYLQRSKIKRKMKIYNFDAQQDKYKL